MTNGWVRMETSSISVPAASGTGWRSGNLFLVRFGMWLRGRWRPLQRRLSQMSDLRLLCDLYGVVDFDP
jgi:hypothetical protein